MYSFILKIITYIHYILQYDETKNNLLIFRQRDSVFYEIRCWYDALPRTVHGEVYEIRCWYDALPQTVHGEVYEIRCWYDALPKTVHGEVYEIWCWYDIRPKESMVKSLHFSLSI
jgi:gamma-glutamylcyclotransferase (GGCT)/AIG2-like uncharacterized protein YtfP